MSGEKKVLIVSWGYTPTFSRSQPSRALYIFNELKRRFPDTYIIMQKGEEKTSELENVIQVKPIIAIRGKFQLLKGIIFRFQITIFTLWFVISKKIDFVILREYDTILIYPFLKLLGIKTFYDFHGLYHYELIQQHRRSRAFFVRYINKILLKLSNKIIVVSAGIKMQIQEYQDKCLYLPNGVDIENIKNASSEHSIELPVDKKVIGFIGNWEPFIKIEDVCESIKYLDNCMGVIIGWGYNAEHIVDKYHTIENLIFTGKLPQEEVYALLKRNDVCILPYDKNDKHSRYPDFFSSRKTKEYIAAGKPIIVADVIGKESWLVENKTCLLYESRDPKDLADKIDILLNNEKLYKTLSGNNKKLAEEYTWENVIKRSGLIEIISGKRG
jgi:glycosyltransferase involved in cell wall biosynthesis